MSRTNHSDSALTRRTVLGAAAGVVAAAAPTATHAAETEAETTVNGMSRYSIGAVAARLDDDLIALRRDLHAHPEPSGEEERTAGVVADLLTAAGLEVTTGVGGHGVVGVLKGHRPGRTVAYRADMDAVSPSEQIGGGEEVAHVCGHDVHTTVGVGVAQVLARLRYRLRGTVVFIFQPAEESLAGAQAMLDDGVLAQHSPEEIHALHCGPLPVGEFAVTPGTGLPGLDRGTVTLTGPGAAERARALAADIGALSTVAPPATSADLEQIVEDLQIPDGPLAEFIFAGAEVGDADTEGVPVGVFYRCWPEERYTEVRDQIGRLARAYDPAAVDFPADPFPAMVCPEKEGHAVKRYLRRASGRSSVTVMQAAFPFNGEDFALFLNQIPGTYTYLGVRAPGADIATSSPHFAAFDPDERAIGVGVRAMAGWLAKRTCQRR